MPYPKKPDDDVKNTVLWFTIPFAAVLYTSLYFVVRWDTQKDHAHFVKRYIAAVVAEKYLDINNRNIPNIHLRYIFICATLTRHYPFPAAGVIMIPCK
ncbi:hypothetical protein KBK19_13080 [Microvirga sp. STR05]|uniref:Uncharacterized protein n=1 Tax=Hymenobacter duratus TaxID=2771356 RepID=A0ABR8JGI0_9BACT|nr:hypothetical protein [Hymenobacter duratus]MBD2715969.1 hypothetical protein [Hymenobacter duratus]MBR7950883.1 hypothetical protein [Microvirga sp. STR05]